MVMTGFQMMWHSYQISGMGFLGLFPDKLRTPTRFLEYGQEFLLV